jgi:hypothetical protein
MGFMLGIALGLVAGIGLCVAILFQKSSDVKKRSHKLDLDFQRLKSQAAQQSQMETHQAERLRGIEATEREFREEIAAKHLQMESHQAERHRKLKEAEHKFQANLTQRLQRLETSEREFQGKKVSYESLNGENYELKQDLFNLTIRIKKSELDSLTLEERQEEIDVLVRKLASKYLKENRAWIGSKLTPSNFSSSKQRLQKTIAACRKIGFDIPEEEEQSLIAELQEEFKRVVRLDYERQEQARIKAQIREEQRLEREVNKLIEEADRERKAIEIALERALKDTKDEHSAEIEELRRKLLEAEEKSQRAISQAQLTKSGHVYVISNIGSFGEGVFKVGMTRRLEPQERVRELSGASVPFPFDVHMMISCDDAPKLENALHKSLHNYRVNRVKPQKEFFRTDVDTIASLVKDNHGEVEYLASPEAVEFFESQNMSDEDFLFVEGVMEDVLEEDDHDVFED